MTTGITEKDLRVPVSLNTGVNLIGLWSRREWNGTDAPPVVRQTNIFPPPPLIGQAAFFGATAEEFNSTLQLRRTWNRPPKRGRERGEHPYYARVESSYNPIITYQGGPGPFYSGSLSIGGGPVCVYSHRWTSADTLALYGKLREKVVGSSFNAAVTMAEGHQSLVLILNAARAVDGAYRHARRGNFKAALQSITGYERSRGRSVAVAKTAARDWLAIQYGVKPLLNDVYSAAQTLAHLSSVPIRQVITVSRKKQGVVVTPSPTLWRWASNYGWSAKRIKCVISEVNVIGLLGLTDPLSVIWEKTPYSFVADWFIPIGNYLEARGLAQNITATYVLTELDKMEGYVATAIPPAVFLNAERGYYKRVEMWRTIPTSLTIPLPEVKPLSSWLSWSHATNAVALVTSNHGSGSKSRI